MTAIRKILVAVKNPDARRHPAIDKAIRIAKSLGVGVGRVNQWSRTSASALKSAVAVR